MEGYVVWDEEFKSRVSAAIIFILFFNLFLFFSLFFSSLSVCDDRVFFKEIKRWLCLDLLNAGSVSRGKLNGRHCRR